MAAPNIACLVFLLSVNHSERAAACESGPFFCVLSDAERSMTLPQTPVVHLHPQFAERP